MNRKYFLTLTAFFILVFILPLCVLKIPFQVDDWDYFRAIVQKNISISKIYEFQRLPVEGFMLYWSYKLLNFFPLDYSTNRVITIFYCFHFLSVLTFYHLILILFRKPKVAFSASLIFLVLPVAVDSLANISLIVRNLGLFFILLGLLFKAKKRKIIGFLLFFLGLNFYESYLIWLPAFFLLNYFVVNKKKNLLPAAAEVLIVIFVFTLKMFLGLNNIVNRGAVFQLSFITKQMIEHLTILIIPNIFGYVFFGSIFFFAVCLLLVFKFVRKFDRIDLALVVYLAFGLGVLSINPYLIPRALYGLEPYFAFFLARLIDKQNQPNKQITFFCLITASILCLYQFFSIQHSSWLVVQAIKKLCDQSPITRKKTIQAHNLSALQGIHLLSYLRHNEQNVIKAMTNNERPNYKLHLSYAHGQEKLLNHNLISIQKKFEYLLFHQNFFVSGY